MLILTLQILAWTAVMAAVLLWLQAVGFAGVALGFFGGWLAFRENTFAAPVVKIQEGQKPIDTGVYGIVRHPMYAGALFYLVGMPLLLGSWRGLAITPLLIAGMAWRIVQEERTLRAELPGYAEYTARVRYRLIPPVW